MFNDQEREKTREFVRMLDEHISLTTKQLASLMSTSALLKKYYGLDDQSEQGSSELNRTLSEIEQVDLSVVAQETYEPPDPPHFLLLRKEGYWEVQDTSTIPDSVVVTHIDEDTGEVKINVEGNGDPYEHPGALLPAWLLEVRDELLSRHDEDTEEPESRAESTQGQLSPALSVEDIPQTLMQIATMRLPEGQLYRVKDAQQFSEMYGRSIPEAMLEIDRIADFAEVYELEDVIRVNTEEALLVVYGDFHNRFMKLTTAMKDVRPF